MTEDTGTRLIRDERLRQISIEGWTPEHDDQHTEGELRDAAIAFLMSADPVADEEFGADIYPDTWDAEWFTKHRDDDAIRKLVIAGALVAAEIDRLLRQRDRL